MKNVFIYGGIMAVLSICLLTIYYNAGRFKYTYEEIDKTREAMNTAHMNDIAAQQTARVDSGTWYLNKWTLYHTLSFEKGNILTIDNHVDTLFRYTYSLTNDTLWLVINEKNLIPNKIKLHDNENLVFESFLDAKEELRYTRTKIVR